MGSMSQRTPTKRLRSFQRSPVTATIINLAEVGNELSFIRQLLESALVRGEESEISKHNYLYPIKELLRKVSL